MGGAVPMGERSRSLEKKSWLDIFYYLCAFIALYLWWLDEKEFKQEKH